MSDAAPSFITLLAAAIAFLGVCIALGQWHTARQKLILDLRDKRYTSYRSVMDTLDEINRLPSPRHQDWRKAERSIEESRLLFGTEVYDSFVALKQALYDIVVADSSERTYRDKGQANEADGLHKMSMEAYTVYDTTLRSLNSKIDPYLRMDQKLPRTPRQWLKHHWNNRPDGTGK